MLKKVLPSVLAAALLLSIGTTSAFAAGLGQGPYFVDANGDGICDYARSEERRVGKECM